MAVGRATGETASWTAGDDGLAGYAWETAGGGWQSHRGDGELDGGR
ncbi:hypothetical protein [Sphaerisporangium flaviroseum]